MDIINRKISELIPAEYNPRQLTKKQFEDLKKSFNNLGTLEPAVINMNKDRKNIVVSGHQRLKVAVELGMNEYPCLEVDFTEKKEREANIRMNKNTGEWDMDALANNFNVEDLVDWGFDDLDIIDGNEIDIKSDEIKPYKLIHFLISINPDDYFKIKDHIDIIEKLGVSVEKGSN